MLAYRVGTPKPMLDYLGWNDALVDYFFRPEMAGRPVYLYVTEELISDLGRGAGEGVADFASAVKVGPSWVTREGFCQRAIQALDDWRVRSEERRVGKECRARE